MKEVNCKLLVLEDDFTAREYYIYKGGLIIDENNNKIFPVTDESSGCSSVYIDIINEEGDFVKKKFDLHRLIALNFIPRTEKDIEYKRDKVVTLDRNECNTSLNNLMWVNQNELDSIIAYNEFGEKDCIKIMYILHMDMNEMKRVLFKTGFIKKKVISKKRYIKNKLKELNLDS